MVQGLGTVVVCIIAGFYFSLGYLRFSQKIQNILKPLCQMAFVLPSMFTILICLNLFKQFPYGQLGVIFIFAVVHLGFSTIYIAEALQCKVGHLFLIAKIYNLKITTLSFRVIWPLIKTDLLILSLIIFINCIASLSIPLIVGGGRGTNLEVYIFEKIFIDQKWSQAIWLAIAQSAILFLISNLMFKQKNKIQIKKMTPQKFVFGSIVAATGLIIFISLYVFGYLLKVVSVLRTTDLSQTFDYDFFARYMNSVSVFFVTSVLFGLSIIFILHRTFHNKKNNFLNLFLCPSTVLIGFGLYLILPQTGFGSDLVKLSMGFFLLFAASLYQSYFATQVDSLRNQMLLAKIYNIRFFEFIKNIFWPQTKKNILFLLSLIYLISLSEFALVKAAGAQIQTVGTLTQQYLNSYRMDQAYVVSFFSLITWCCFYFSVRMCYECDQKSKL